MIKIKNYRNAVILLDDIEQKVKHLEFIQGVVNRMSSNSFLIKGWCITMVSAIFVLAGKDMNTKFMIIAYMSVAAFWILDCYYLYQEKLFRDLYDYIRIKNQTDFSMKTASFKIGKNGWLEYMFSTTLNIFYMPLIIIMWVVLIYIIK